jgi:hypothetical protein
LSSSCKSLLVVAIRPANSSVALNALSFLQTKIVNCAVTHIHVSVKPPPNENLQPSFLTFLQHHLKDLYSSSNGALRQTNFYKLYLFIRKCNYCNFTWVPISEGFNFFLLKFQKLHN